MCGEVNFSLNSKLKCCFIRFFTGKLCHAISFRWGGERRRLLRKNGRDKTPQRMRGGLAVRPPESEAVPLTIYPYTLRQSLSSSYVRKQPSLRKELFTKTKKSERFRYSKNVESRSDFFCLKRICLKALFQGVIR